MSAMFSVAAVTEEMISSKFKCVSCDILACVIYDTNKIFTITITTKLTSTFYFSFENVTDRITSSCLLRL
jgi:hypothetical protein